CTWSPNANVLWQNTPGRRAPPGTRRRPASSTRSRPSGGPPPLRPDEHSNPDALCRHDILAAAPPGTISGEAQRPVVDPAVSQRQEILQIVHAQPPRSARARPRELVDRALDVSGIKLDQWLFRDTRVVVDGYTLLVPRSVHVPQHPHDVL